MALSINFINHCRNIYNHTIYSNINNYNNLDFGKNNIFNKFLVTKYESLDNIEIPTIMLQNVISYINEYPKCSKGTIIAMPIAANHTIFPTSSALSIVKAFFKNNLSSIKIVKVSLKNNIYYGGPGIIMNDKFEPLFLSTLQGSVVFNAFHYPQFIVSKFNIYINKKVVIDTNDTVSKIILNKLVPFYIQETPLIHYNGFYAHYSSDHKYDEPTIIIGDIEKFFSSVFSVHPTETINKELNEWLCNHKDLVCL